MPPQGQPASAHRFDDASRVGLCRPQVSQKVMGSELFTPIDSLNGTVTLHLDPLQFPHGKAPDVDVELVQSGIVAIVRELNFEL